MNQPLKELLANLALRLVLEAIIYLVLLTTSSKMNLELAFILGLELVQISMKRRISNMHQL